MGKEFDLHRHDEYSTFDGFGKPLELAKLAKELGYDSLCTTNHGNTHGLIKTYKACKEYDLKAILGVEGYFLPKHKEKHRGYHLILIAKNLKGYGNLNRIQYEGEKQKYFNPIWDFDILDKYHEGLICTSACVGGFLGQCIKHEKNDTAIKYLKKMQSIFGDDFYIEVQPYDIDETVGVDGEEINLQRVVNVKSIQFAKELGIKCILTSDSHRGRKEDWETYSKMHEIAGHDLEWAEKNYKERYMPLPGEMKKRFLQMHKDDFSKDELNRIADKMIANLEEIEDKCERDYLDQLGHSLPKLYDDSYQVLVDKVKQGLKTRGKYNKMYLDRAMEELDVIKYHNFEDYFLMVQDYVVWAKEHGIVVGPGRGSACNSLVCYALRITEVDSVYFDLEFRRFLMKERKKFPDIDLDFETDRRDEVIEYCLQKYKGHAAQICSYGLYKIDNLINDLTKVCGLPTDKNVDSEIAKYNKRVISDIKKFVNSCIEDGFLLEGRMILDDKFDYFNKEYDNILVHFMKLYEKVRFIGTHAAGVAITGGNLLDYTAFKVDSKSGKIYTVYDLNDIEDIGVIKFDMLGLKTMAEMKDCRKYTGIKDFDIKMTEDPAVIQAFSDGRCDGVFQFVNSSSQNLLVKIGVTRFDDVVAASAMNRPGPLQQKQPDIYAANKQAVLRGDEGQRNPILDKYLQKTYGTIIYQEQVMLMAVELADMTWDEAHYITKVKRGAPKFNSYFENEYPKFGSNFIKNTKKLGMPAEQAMDIFSKFYQYSFNQGHSVGYSLISAEQMYYKVYYPVIFWYTKIKYAKDEAEISKFCECAVADGAIVFIPHVNYSVEKGSLRKMEGEYVIQQGFTSIKGVGDVASREIARERKENGIFTSYDNFLDRMQGKKVNKNVIALLLEYGALEFNKKTYIGRVKKYNSALYARAQRKR